METILELEELVPLLQEYPAEKLRLRQAAVRRYRHLFLYTEEETHPPSASTVPLEAACRFAFSSADDGPSPAKQ